MALRILIACEYSGVVRDAFRRRGFDAWSCDLLQSERGGNYHVQGDVRNILGAGWTMMIAHPDCTYLTSAAEWAYKDDPGKKMRPGVLFGAERRAARESALRFVDELYSSDIPHVAVENPVGVISTRLPHLPSPQYIQPYEFGEDASKRTGLWLKNLPSLTPTSLHPGRIVTHNGRQVERWSNQTDSGQNRLPPSANRWKERARTYNGVADAMAAQWGAYLRMIYGEAA